MTKNNPDAASSDQCARCRKFPTEISKCSKCSKCDSYYHNGCLKQLKNIKYLKDGTIICCSDNETTIKDSESASSPNEQTENSASVADKLTIRYLEEIMKQKEIIIKQQDQTIQALKDQIILMKQVASQITISPKISASTHKHTIPVTNTNNLHVKNSNQLVDNGNNSMESYQIRQSMNQHQITSKSVAGAVHGAESLQICQDIINLERPTPMTRRSILIGKNENSTNFPFKAARRNISNEKHYHVTNLEPEIDTTKLSDYLKKFAPNIQVQKLNSRQPEVYSSVKITVPSDESDKILNSEVWPSYVIDSQTINCCVGTTENSSDLMSPNPSINPAKNSIDEIRITYLEEIIRQKDLVITNQEIAIKSLQSQIELIQNQASFHSQNSKYLNEYTSINVNQSRNDAQSSSRQGPSWPASNLNSKHVSAAIHEAKTSSVCADIINLNKTNQSIKPNFRSYPKPKSLLVGSMRNDDQNLKAANVSTDITFYHSTNWNPNTVADDVRNHLKNIDDEVKVEQLKSRQPQLYASFKIIVPSTSAQKLLNTEIWPEGVYLNEFFRYRRQYQANQDTTNEQ
ncbi:unnamed protein product [Psylliodes chrysocephalus]|uniref:Phorbol-ester/DAG-type domain-containing protein n=1 Tax=Psylliodes chrysocephalus TaxID=3402493 RepID=A0A9P0G8F3_9CUCU|nr:unnamed protein product [Psylliodes chrysocephala]